MCSIEIKDSSFENHLYPFKGIDYKTSNMLKYVQHGVKIDSGYNKISNGETVPFYKFYDDNSKFVVF